NQGAISRRKLLASLGMAGVGLMAMGTAGATGTVVSQTYSPPGADSFNLNELNEPPPHPSVVATTIAALRTNEQPDANLVYFVKDDGKEGCFLYDPTDTSSGDNTGTVVVSTSGVRFKRIYETGVNVRWFGATGDGVTDDTAAIRSAVDVADTIWFPKPRVAYRMSLITMPRM
ncbi:MAG: hypothetical protein K0Q94_356, partial [Paenibacillus sp.]|nr:hypothetical protein [Paenibacillus sp.]